MTTPNLQIRQVYNFDVWPSGIIGNSFQNVTVLALMDRETANREIDTIAMHIQCYPSFSATGTPDDADAYDYVKLRTSSGQIVIIGLAWIKSDTVALVDARTITVKIGNVASSDLARVKAALTQNGYNNLDMSIT